MRILKLWLALLVIFSQSAFASDSEDDGPIACPSCQLNVRTLKCTHEQTHLNQNLLKYVINGLSRVLSSLDALRYLPEIYANLGQFSRGENLAKKIYDAELASNLKDLVTSRLNKDLIISSPTYIFSGVEGVLRDAAGTRVIQSRERVSTLFGPKETDILRLSLYEMLEIFLDAVFGLKSGIEGVPPPDQRIGSLVLLLKYKFDFVIGEPRDGMGQSYGLSHTPNHFADGDKTSGHFDIRRHYSKVLQDEEKEAASSVETNPDSRIIPGGDVVKFFKAHKAETDYERLSALFGVFTTSRI